MCQRELIMLPRVNSKHLGVAAGKNEQLAVCDSSLSHMLTTSDLFIFEEKITSLQIWANDKQQQLCSEVEADVLAWISYLCLDIGIFHTGMNYKPAVWVLLHNVKCVFSSSLPYDDYLLFANDNLKYCHCAVLWDSCRIAFSWSSKRSLLPSSIS